MKTTKEQNEKSGVYKLQCYDCNGIFVGTSKRPVLKRYEEHIAEAKFNIQVLGLANHLINRDHSTSLDK